MTSCDDESALWRLRLRLRLWLYLNFQLFNNDGWLFNLSKLRLDKIMSMLVSLNDGNLLVDASLNLSDFLIVFKLFFVLLAIFESDLSILVATWRVHRWVVLT